jgi:hypothetical protein
MMIYNPEYAGVRINPHESVSYAGSTYRVSGNNYKMPLKNSYGGSFRSQRSLKSLPRNSRPLSQNLGRSEESLLARNVPYDDEIFNKSIEEMVAEKLDQEVERRVKMELAKILSNGNAKPSQKQIRFSEEEEKLT